ncbi:hypothetical protein CC85DRAFT_288042 [Cutaneotrichosporon oleaginosum]|uniref:Uncharacterized protein n=1 Tax=Cutaneotrichosporon oleaginosum TaxID=879819 RepID=A0A0J0XFW5_9TREE|nr:uncharacterized protein CC85DRAFT_288042 [Cutaneotrichosporon oleaginosum]KLT39952.1 hypothetical protein CC85DRAFT_288042 [Cutaneotrichosporon oleaginosum]TXT08364.1 hypothetical protein COLE_05288 [Cutaneotrichosporon oleaginosum]
MRFGSVAALVGLVGSLPAMAYRVAIKDTDSFREVCSGMFGGNKAYVELAFDEHAVGQVALVMYEYSDSEYIGRQPPDDGSWQPKTYICTTTTVRAGICTTAQLGTFLTTLPEGKELKDTSIYTSALRFDPQNAAVGGTGGDAAPAAGVEAEEGKGDSKNTRRQDDEEVDDVAEPETYTGQPAESPPTDESESAGNSPAQGESGSTVGSPAEGSSDGSSHGQGGTNAIPPTNSGDGVEVGSDVPVYTKPIRMDVPKTGYYCVAVIPVTLVTKDRRDLEVRKNIHAEYEGVITFRNQFDGELPAVEYPKIAFYGVLSVVYIVLAIGWGILCAKHYQELLPMQYYISGTIVFLVIEMIALFTYYRYINKHGGGAGSIAFLIVISILNAARNSLSFFLLLIVAMGLSVVTPSLGPVMMRVWLLTAFHFIFGVTYAIGTVKVELDSASIIIVLLMIFPLSFTLTAFLMWIIVSLNGTILHLQQRKQNFKLSMFQSLYRILVIAVIAVAAFFVLSSISLSNRLDEDYAPRNWRWRWILLDASLSLIYLSAFVAIAWLWRPTENNVRFAMSQELAQDEEDAEDYELGPHDPDAVQSGGSVFPGLDRRDEGLALPGLLPHDGREHVHGERHSGDEHERERLFDADAAERDSPRGSRPGSGGEGYRVPGSGSGSGSASRSGYAPHTNDDNVVFAMGDDSDDSDAESGKLLTRVSLNSSRGGSRRNSQSGRYKDKAD